MKFSKTLTIGLMVVLATLLVGCGPSKEQLRQAAVNAAKLKALTAYDQVKQAKSGDDASQARADVLAILADANLELNAISVEKSELDQLVADKYFADAKGQIVLLRDKKIGFKAAQAAKTEFLRAQKLSGRRLISFGVTAKSIDSLGAAHKAPAKKRATTR
jgi:hypothetical protein